MPRTKEASKLSKQLTKDFEKLVKSFARQAAKDKRSLAFVVGYLDSATGNVTNLKPSPEGEAAYSQGFKAAGGRTYTLKNGRMKRKKT